MNHRLNNPTCAKPIIALNPALVTSALLAKAAAVGGMMISMAWDVPMKIAVEIATLRNSPPTTERLRINRTKQNSPNIMDNPIEIIAARKLVLICFVPLLKNVSPRADHSKNAAMMASVMNNQKKRTESLFPRFFSAASCAAHELHAPIGFRVFLPQVSHRGFSFFMLYYV